MKLMFVILALTISTPAAAETCNIPAGWAKPTPHLAARTTPMTFALTVGPATRLTLLAPTEVKPAVVSAHKPKPGTFSGLAALDVTRAGKLDVALSTATYVDLVRDGKILASTDHRHGEACTGIRKIVTFDVTPGRYIVQLDNAPDKTVTVQATLN